MRSSALFRARAALGLAALLAAGCQGIDPTPGDEPVSPAARERYVKRRVEDAQAFRVQKRFEAAEHQLRLALSSDPDHRRAHALLARTLNDLGREAEAKQHAARARALARAPAAPPHTPVVADASGVLVLLVPPDAPRYGSGPAPGEWGDPALRGALAGLLRERLPGASVEERLPGSVKDAEAWLLRRSPRGVISLRVDQAVCAETVKDGAFARVSLTVVSAVAGALPGEPVALRALDDDPPLPPECVDVALAYAVDKALALPNVAAALAAPSAHAQAGWAGLVARALVPPEVRAAGEITRSRAEAAEQPAIPPDVERIIAWAEQERARDHADAASPATATQDPETLALEAEVAAERRRRDELLAALRVDELAQRAPTADEVGALRASSIERPDDTGPSLARTLAGGQAVEIRQLLAPDGAAIARFYFVPGAASPLLREEDTNQDGSADRWTAYAAGRPKEIWEDRGASGHVNAHLVLEDDGATVERIEIDMAGRGHHQRTFRYESGVLVEGAEDTRGDGILDRFERFAPDGSLTVREEDLDADGHVDVRSEFRDGKLVRREILDPKLIESLSSPRDTTR